MKTVKLIFASLILLTIGFNAFAGHNKSQAVIHQLNKDQISVKAEICDVDEMRVEITNEDGDIVISDAFKTNNGIAAKIYDFSETRVGGYYVTVYCNDEILETTVIGEGTVAKKDSYYFVLN